MKNLIYSSGGCDVFDEDGELFVYYDSGESAGSVYLRSKLNIEQFEKFKKSSDDACQVLVFLKPKAELAKDQGLDGITYPRFS